MYFQVILIAGCLYRLSLGTRSSFPTDHWRHSDIEKSMKEAFAETYSSDDEFSQWTLRPSGHWSQTKSLAPSRTIAPGNTGAQEESETTTDTQLLPRTKVRIEDALDLNIALLRLCAIYLNHVRGKQGSAQSSHDILLQFGIVIPRNRRETGWRPLEIVLNAEDIENREQPTTIQVPQTKAGGIRQLLAKDRQDTVLKKRPDEEVMFVLLGSHQSGTPSYCRIRPVLRTEDVERYDLRYCGGV